MTLEQFSLKVFELAEQFGIPTTPGQEVSMSDEAYFDFCREYRKFSLSRDESLKRHLDATPTLFRVFLPYNSRVFALAQQVMWYLDEVVVRDPIERWLDQEGLRPETGKSQIANSLQLLSHFRAHLESGYLLLAGASLLQAPLSSNDNLVVAALGNERLVELFDQAAEYGLMRVKDDEWNDYTRFEVYLPDVGGSIGFSGKMTAGTHELLRVGERLPKTDPSEVEAFLAEGWRDEHYSEGIIRIINSVETARSMSAAILFDRQLPAQVLNELQQAAPSEARQIASIASFKVTLPYLDNVPPERLMEVRESIPESFRLFRSTMHKIVQDAVQLHEVPNESLQTAVDQEVLPQLLTLEAELKSISQRKRLLGYGLPVVSAVDALAGGILGVPPLALLGLGVGGPLAGVKEVADALGKQTLHEANPFYFIWQAKKS